MYLPFLITFRETLEATLVIGIVLTFLTKTNQSIFRKYVWSGVAAGTVVSILIAVILEMFFGGFKEPLEQIFEGTMMLITAGFITWMILWVHQQRDVSKKIKEKVALHAESGYSFGIFVLVFTSLLREGIETVLYLKASAFLNQSNQLIGAVMGILAAIGFGYAIFRWAIRVNLSVIFNITSIFLILFAAGLVSHGVHEFQEVGILPIFSFDPIFNISQILDHGSVFGSFLRTLFGYTSKPTILEILSYGGYVGIIIWIQKMTSKTLLKPE